MKEQLPKDGTARHADGFCTHNARFRAEADDLGRWFVWQRLGATGWAAWRACSSRSDAVNLAASLNQQPAAAPTN